MKKDELVFSCHGDQAITHHFIIIITFFESTHPLQSVILYYQEHLIKKAVKV